MRRTPDKTELWLGLGLIIVLGLCPTLGVAIVFGMIFLTK